MVLSHSRRGYSEVVWRLTTESFIRCLENGFRHFGGVPKTLVIDNLRAAVTRADWFDPDLNPKVEEFCRHYGTAMMPTRPAMPRHKGKIEAGVKYGQNNAVKGRQFTSLAEQNIFLSDWERTVADTRIHGTTRRQVIKVFNEVNGPNYYLCRRACSGLWKPRLVHRDGYVELNALLFGAPGYVGRQVWVRWDSRSSASSINAEQGRCMRIEPGKFATDPQHLHSRYRHVIQHNLDYLLDRARLIGKYTELGEGWCNNAALSARECCMACCPWRANILSAPWKALLKKPCITARGA